VVAAPAARDGHGVTPTHERPDSDDPGSTAEHGKGARGGAPVLVAVLLTLVLVAALAVAVWSGTRLQTAEEGLEARSDVVRAAERFTVAVNNYDSESVDDYQADVSELLSTKFRSEFESAMEDIVLQVRQAEMSSQGEVLASGVATLDEDSARVLVVADAAVETVADQRQRHFRWEVSLVKVDGEWLVDDFAPVA
jgi:Mce-associated membrane protein